MRPLRIDGTDEDMVQYNERRAYYGEDFFGEDDPLFNESEWDEAFEDDIEEYLDLIEGEDL